MLYTAIRRHSSAVCSAKCTGEGCRLVVGFKRWLDTRGSGGPTPGDPGPIETRRKTLLSRLHQHTDKCPGCMEVRSSLCSWGAHLLLRNGLLR